jgi:hypothetical protein
VPQLGFAVRWSWSQKKYFRIHNTADKFQTLSFFFQVGSDDGLSEYDNEPAGISIWQVGQHPTGLPANAGTSRNRVSKNFQAFSRKTCIEKIQCVKVNKKVEQLANVIINNLSGFHYFF